VEGGKRAPHPRLTRLLVLADPLYPGLRQRRLEGEAYLAFVDEFVEAVQLECPGAVLHWEDFGTRHARPLLVHYRNQLPSFNDDIQGTRRVASAAVLAACRGLVDPRSLQSANARHRISGVSHVRLAPNGCSHPRHT